MIFIYKILGLILIPIIKINIFLRIANSKESPTRYKERFGISNYTLKSDRNIIWIHAASVGEFKSADYFINKYHKDFEILVTTTTISAANYAQKNYGEKIIHQFAPLDVSIWVKRFLKKWKPKLILWIESDMWPITLCLFKKEKINAVFINARLSPKSYKRWSLFPFIYNKLINCFSEVFAQSKIDQKRINQLCNKKIEFIGNMKLKNSHHNFQKNKLINLEKKFTIMLASTHHNEEAVLIPFLSKILENNKNMQLIIAPRHPERSKKIISICNKNNLFTTLHSKMDSNISNVVVVDSFGILQNYFYISDIVFLGGSLISAGGHNPIEAALLNCAILTGKNFFNWENIYKDMLENKACIKVESLKDFKFEVENLINDKNKLKIMQSNAYNFVKKQFVDTNILDKTIIKHLNFDYVEST